MLRAGVLDGVCVLLAQASEATSSGRTEGSLGAAVAKGCSELGARVVELSLPIPAAGPIEWGPLEHDARESIAAAVGVPEARCVLVVDCASLFAAGKSGEAASRRAMRACVDGAWTLTHAAVEPAFMAHGGPGRIVYLAPAPTDGEHSPAALAGLENLSRTLSVEWARHGLTAVTIATGAGEGAADEAAGLVAYLASPAGSYFSGCLLDLRG